MINSKLYLASLMILFTTTFNSGCAFKPEMIKGPEAQPPISLKAESISFEKASMSYSKTELYGQIAPLSDFQDRFRDAAGETILAAIRVDGQPGLKIKSKLTRAEIAMQRHPLTNVPLLGIAAAGSDQNRFVGDLAGVLEVEDQQGRVIDKADFAVRHEDPNKSLTSFDFANACLAKLDEEVRKAAKRYLHKYLAEQ